VDCRCFDLVASGAEGQAPYKIEWDDGSANQSRRVCISSGATELDVTVVVQDAKGRRSAVRSTKLVADPTACATASPAPKLCITNPSFEGTPATNVAVPGLPNMFDAPPWSVCTNPMATNTPDIGDANLARSTGVPPPTHGATFLALAESEQVSQALCAPVNAGTDLAMQIDLLDLTATVMASTGPIALEIWGGLAADCTARELLWTSEPLPAGWKTYCAKLHPEQYMDQITLRAKSDTTNAGQSYMGMDHLVPVDSCP
jgi:hypothetical protein